MSNEDSKSRVAAGWLRSHGFTVEPIPRAATKTADLRASDRSSSYLVEVTARADSGFWDRLFERAKESGETEEEEQEEAEEDEHAEERSRRGIATEGRRIERCNTLDGVIRDKVRQLAETAPGADFRVLWVDLLDDDWQHRKAVLERTLYGVVRLTCYRDSCEPMTVRTCYYYDLFAYYKYRALNAVVMRVPRGARLLVNSHAEKIDAFRQSRLYERFGGAALDPHVTASEDSVLVLPREIDRKAGSDARWRHILEQHGLKTSPMREESWSGAMSLEDLVGDERKSDCNAGCADGNLRSSEHDAT